MAGEAPIRIVKKVHGEHGHHGGAWKVAFADFMTAMMAFFLVMWILGLSESSRKAIQGYFNDPIGFTEGFENGKNPLATTGFPEGAKDKRDSLTAKSIDGPAKRQEQRMMEAVRHNIDIMLQHLKGKSALAGQIEVSVTQEGLRIELVDKHDVGFFEIGSATLNPGAVGLVKMLAVKVAALKNEAIIEGHTDARQYAGSKYTNFELSADRASTARRFFEKFGRKGQVTQVRGCASSKLRRPDDPMSFENRRITILVKFSDDAMKSQATKLEDQIVGKLKPKIGLDAE